MGTDLRRQSRLFRGVGRKASPARKPFQLVCGEANVKRSWAVASRSLPVVGLPGAHPSAFIPNGIAAEAVSALVNLGYKRNEAERAVERAAVSAAPLEEVIRSALKGLGAGLGA